jgi:amino acid transporter
MEWNIADWKTAVVWLYIMGWSAYGVETCAAFAPEYKDTVRDTTLALRSAAMFSLAVYILLPLGVAGTVGQETISNDGSGIIYLIDGFTAVLGGGADIMVVLLIASLFISMNTATADGARALYGIARDGVTIKELYHLNRFHVPARAMTVDMIVNLGLVFFVGNTLAILYTGNVGYVLAHFFALTAFILLRRDRPNWPRPIRVSSIFVPIAAVLALANAVFIYVGLTDPGLTYAAETKHVLIGLAVLAISVLLFFYRRLVQDKTRIVFQEQTPDMPPATVPSPGAPVS